MIFLHSFKNYKWFKGFIYIIKGNLNYSYRTTHYFLFGSSHIDTLSWKYCMYFLTDIIYYVNVKCLCKSISETHKYTQFVKII